MEESGYCLYNLTNKQGWLLSHQHQKDHYSPFIQFGRTNFSNPWSDPEIHYHTTAQELYFVLQGELWLTVEEIPIVLPERSCLLVRPRIPHTVVGGKGKIQHFGMKIPHILDEKVIVKKTTRNSEKNSFLSTKKQQLPKRKAIL